MIQYRNAILFFSALALFAYLSLFKTQLESHPKKDLKKMSLPEIVETLQESVDDIKVAEQTSEIKSTCEELIEQVSSMNEALMDGGEYCDEDRCADGFLLKALLVTAVDSLPECEQQVYASLAPYLPLNLSPEEALSILRQEVTVNIKFDSWMAKAADSNEFSDLIFAVEMVTSKNSDPDTSVESTKEQLLSKIIELAPNEPLTHIRLLEHCFRFSHSSLCAMLDTLASDSEDKNVLSNLATVKFKLGLVDEAQQLLQKAAELPTSTPVTKQYFEQLDLAFRKNGEPMNWYTLEQYIGLLTATPMSGLVSTQIMCSSKQQLNITPHCLEIGQQAMKHRDFHSGIYGTLMFKGALDAMPDSPEKARHEIWWQEFNDTLPFEEKQQETEQLISTKGHISIPESIWQEFLNKQETNSLIHAYQIIFEFLKQEG